MLTFLATFLTPRWILLISSLIEYRLTFLATQCYPVMQGKPFGPCVHLPRLTYIPFLICWQLLHVFSVANPAIWFPRWRCLQSLSTHLWEDILIKFFPRFSSPIRVFFATLNLMFQTLRPSRSGSYYNFYRQKFSCATLIPHSTLAINVNPPRRMKLHILLTTWLPIPWILLTNSHDRLIMFSYMPSLNIQPASSYSRMLCFA